MKKKLITLAKELDFTTENEYFDYLIDCYMNGNFSSCRRLFADMKKKTRKELLTASWNMAVKISICFT